MTYTSYFGNIKCIKQFDENAVLISIAGKTPDWFFPKLGLKMHEFAPQWSWWKEWHEKFKDNLESDESKAWYTDKYNSTVLSKLDPNEICKTLIKMSFAHDIFLLCYETPEKFCHRHLVAQWLQDAGVDVTEFCADESNSSQEL